MEKYTDGIVPLEPSMRRKEPRLLSYQTGSILTLDAYQRHAISTSVYPGQGTVHGLVYAALGLGEAGEVQNKVKKILRDDNGILTEKRREQIKGELGGNLWYIAALADEMGMSLAEIAQYNIDSLAARQVAGTLHGDGDNR